MREPKPIAYGIALDAFPPVIPPSSAVVRHHLTWRFGVAPVPGDQQGWVEALGDSLRVGWGDYADYVLRPSHDDVAITSTVDESEAAIGFLLSVLPLALPLFGFEPFHGSAVSDGTAAILILGPSGSGKSSLASALGHRGWHFVTDDACAIDDDFRVWPGPPFLNPRIPEAPQHTIGHYNGKPLRSPDLPAQNPVPVRGVVLLNPGSRGVGLRAVEDEKAAFRGVLGNTRAPWVYPELRRSFQLHVAAHLAANPIASVPVHDVGSDLAGAVRDLESWWEDI